MSEGIPSHGDRAAWDTINYATEHAKDIDDGTLRRHLATPGLAGDLMIDDGADWQRVSMGGDATIAADGTVTVLSVTIDGLRLVWLGW